MKNNKFIYIALCSIGFIACEPEFDQPLEGTPIAVQSAGEADFSNYVSIGNSLTAGFADGALYRSGQENSFANILANQMKTAGGGNFNTPFMTDDIGGFAGFEDNFGTRLVLQIGADGSRTPVRLSETASNDITATVEGSINNFGVPGAKSFHLAFEGYGNPAGIATGMSNPYFARFAQNPNSSVIGDAIASAPTFFTMWIGNNDVLSYATSGGSGILQPTPTTTDFSMIPPPGGDDISNPAYFGGVYSQLIAGLTSTGAKGVLVNVPDVSTIPFFTTVPFNAIPLDQATADAANAGFAPYNGGLQLAFRGGAISAKEAARRTINFTAGQNAVVILDENLTDITAINAGLLNIRQATDDDLLVLPASAFLGTPNAANNALINGVSAPLADKWVLTPEEQKLLSDATNAYNQTIKGLTDDNPNIVLLNANKLLKQLANGGLISEGTKVTSTFGTGGAFSLDGIHLTPRGNAVITNELIKVINKSFNATLQPVDPNRFKTISLK